MGMGISSFTLSSSQQEGQWPGNEIFQAHIARQQDHALTAVLPRTEHDGCRQQPDSAAAAQQRQLRHQHIQHAAGQVVVYPVKDRLVKAHAAVTPPPSSAGARRAR